MESSSEETGDEPSSGWCGCCLRAYSPLPDAEPSSESRVTNERHLTLVLPSDASGTQTSSRPGTPSLLVELPHDYDPQLEYVRHYAVDGYSPSVSPGKGPVMRQDSFHSSVLLQKRAVLSAAAGEQQHVSPREIRRSLGMLELQIRLEQNLEQRLVLILEYEAFKARLDYDSPEDAEKARYALADARNERLDTGERLGFYRNAVRYTNEPQQKEALRLEYVQFCEQLQNRVL